MHRFSVWAPRPAHVDVVTGPGDDARRVTPMERVGAGWWEATVESAGPGTCYGFSLEGGPLRPDPRSASQPFGVDGPSEVVDLGGFPWTDEAWPGLSPHGAVLYELHVGTFSAAGTFDGAVSHLPHLIELGVDAVELLPIVEFPGHRGWGYDGVDLFAPHHAYGGPAGLLRLVDACHRHGLGVVLDVVYNHLGPAGNYLGDFGPYFSDRHRTDWGAAINLDGPGSEEVRRFVVDNACTWLRDYHVDGLRLDAVHAMVDESPRHVLESLAEEVDALATSVGRPLLLFAESDRYDPRLVRPRQTGGYGLHASWADEWHHALHAVLTGEQAGCYEAFGSLTVLGAALRQGWVYDGPWTPQRRRRRAKPPTGLGGDRFVVCTQNHDQVGNRAGGERLTALTNAGRCKVAAALLLSSPFTPMVFQGEEWGAGTPFHYFTDHGPEVGEAVRRGRQRELAAFAWTPDEVPDPQAVSLFEASKLRWGELDVPGHAELLAWYRELTALRRRIPELRDPQLTTMSVEVDEERGALVVHRGDLVIYVNLGSEPVCFSAATPLGVLASSDAVLHVDGCSVTVPADAVVVAAPAHRAAALRAATSGSGDARCQDRAR